MEKGEWAALGHFGHADGPKILIPVNECACHSHVACKFRPGPPWAPNGQEGEDNNLIGVYFY